MLTVALIFALAGLAVTLFTHRPTPGGKGPPMTSGQSGTDQIDPKSVGGPNDARQPLR